MRTHIPQLGAFLLLLLFVVRCATTPAQEAAKRNEAVMGAAVVPTKPFTPLCSTVGADGGAVCPSSWGQAAWFLDPQNTSTCASDGNATCALSTCGTPGDGPCLSYAQISTRWGTVSPRIRQTTTLTVMSSMSPADVGYLNPLVEGTSNQFVVTCTLGSAQQQWSQALGAVTVKNRATPQLLAAVITPALPAVDQYLVNSGPGGAGSAWITHDQSGTTWNISQPVTGCTPASCVSVAGSLAENNSWTTGDTVTAYVPSKIYFSQILPQTTASTSQRTGLPAVTISQCFVAAIGGASDTSALAINQLVSIQNSEVQTTTTDSLNGVAGAGGPQGGTRRGTATAHSDWSTSTLRALPRDSAAPRSSLACSDPTATGTPR